MIITYAMNDGAPGGLRLNKGLQLTTDSACRLPGLRSSWCFHGPRHPLGCTAETERLLPLIARTFRRCITRTGGPVLVGVDG